MPCADDFSAEERSLLVYLCGQAAVSAGNLAQHELLRDAEARLRHQAYHDGLTGLANRALFAERVNEAIRRAPDSVAVLYLDLESPAQARLVGAVIRLAGTLGVPVIAEGIERPSQLERLRALGGNLGQGFLLGHPAEVGDLELTSGRLAALTAS